MNKIVTAISKIMADVGSVKKDGENKFHNYKYATASDILHKLQPLLAREGLVIFQHEIASEMIADGLALAVTYEFVLAHREGEVWPEKPRYTGIAAARNAKGGFDDKSGNKCHTAARKYFMLALFQIPTGDYDDADEQEDRPAGKPKRENPHVTRPEDVSDAKPRHDERGNRIDWIDTSEHRVERLSNAKARPVAEALNKAMRMNKTPAELVEWGIDHAEQVASLPAAWEEIFQSRYQEFLDELRTPRQEAAE